MHIPVSDANVVESMLFDVKLKIPSFFKFHEHIFNFLVELKSMLQVGYLVCTRRGVNLKETSRFKKMLNITQLVFFPS